jgi:uncharacterized membrane protein YphA (DoxX/SURF4 family)
MTNYLELDRVGKKGEVMNQTTTLIMRAKGLILTPLRVCMGWLMFSAFWRRVVLKPEALNILSPEYEGIKFNHFLPSSLGIEPLIKYLIENPEFLYVFLWIFTIIEGLVGLGLIFGFFTRLVSFVTTFLLCGVMLGAGWLGTTCVDEWQIGVFGVSAGMTLFLGGGGPISIDAYLSHKKQIFRKSRLYQLLCSGSLFPEDSAKRNYHLVLVLSMIAIIFTLITNQGNVRGVWGPFKNPAAKPHIALSHLHLERNGDLTMRIYRNAGPDTYGAFVVGVQVLDNRGRKVLSFDQNYLGHLSSRQIQNLYLVHAKSNTKSLVVPLGAVANIELYPTSSVDLKSGTYKVEVIGIDNEKWSAPVEVNG